MLSDFIFWTNVLITSVSLTWIIVNRISHKPSPNILRNALYQILLPLSIIAAFASLEAGFEVLESMWITLFVLFNSIVTGLCFLIFHFTYFWHRANYSNGPQRFIVHNFKNCEPDGAPVDTFTSKYEQNVDFVKLVETNLDTLLNIATTDFLGDIIHEYEIKYGKTFDLNPTEPPESEKKPHKVVGKGGKNGKEEKPIAEPPPEDPNLEKERKGRMLLTQAKIRETKKAIFLAILKETFQGWHFHIIYYKWDFQTPMVEKNLSSYTKSYILTLKEKLPVILNMNTSLLYPEVENGKKMTSLFCLEGERNEYALTKTTNITNDLDSFVKPWPKIFEIERIRKERDWWKAFATGLNEGEEDMLKTSITLATRRRKLMPDEDAERMLKDARKRAGEAVIMP